MPRHTLNDEIQLIESIVAAHPNGIAISGIEADMERRQGTKPNRRTLQRRLQKLIGEQRLTTEGTGIALVYKRIPDAVMPAPGSAIVTTTAWPEPYVPVSAEGAAIRNRLRQPLMHRHPVGYQHERSCQRYLAITQTMVEPDPLKIKYREALIQAVQTIVKSLQPPSQTVIADIAQHHAAEIDQAAFRAMLTVALQQLHEGSIARYRLRRSEYLAWQRAQRPV